MYLRVPFVLAAGPYDVVGVSRVVDMVVDAVVLLDLVVVLAVGSETEQRS